MKAKRVRCGPIALACGSSLLYLLWRFFRWPLTAKLDHYETIRSLLAAELLLFAAGCAGYLLLRRPARRGSLLAAIVLGLLALPLAQELPLDRWSLNLDYRWHLSERTAVVAEVADGGIAYDSLGHRGVISLKREFPNAAHGIGEVAIWREGAAPDVYFPVARGSVDGVMGFYYYGGSGPLQPEGVLPFTTIKRYGEHWYWVEG